MMPVMNPADALEVVVPQTDLPPGRTFVCRHCGTRLRLGQPHSALKPWPHQNLDALIVHERIADE